MTNKTKNILITIGFVVALLICYQLAFSKTLNLRNNYSQLRKEKSIYSNIPKTLSNLRQKEKYYDSLQIKYQLNGGSIQNTLLKNINEYSNANNLKIVSFFEPHVVVQNDLTIKSYQFSIEGDYNSIIKLIYKIEQETKFGEIENVFFEKKKNFKTGKDYLQVQILLKSYG